MKSGVIQFLIAYFALFAITPFFLKIVIAEWIYSIKNDLLLFITSLVVGIGFLFSVMAYLGLIIEYFAPDLHTRYTILFIFYGIYFFLVGIPIKQKSPKWRDRVVFDKKRKRKYHKKAN